VVLLELNLALAFRLEINLALAFRLGLNLALAEFDAVTHESGINLLCRKFPQLRPNKLQFNFYL